MKPCLALPRISFQQSVKHADVLVHQTNRVNPNLTLNQVGFNTTYTSLIMEQIYSCIPYQQTVFQNTTVFHMGELIKQKDLFGSSERLILFHQIYLPTALQSHEEISIAIKISKNVIQVRLYGSAINSSICFFWIDTDCLWQDGKIIHFATYFCLVIMQVFAVLCYLQAI